MESAKDLGMVGISRGGADRLILILYITGAKARACPVNPASQTVYQH